MSNHRYSPEFKDEAVRQILERGYSVAEVAERLGVSAHSLHKWVKAIKPDKSEEQAAELNEAKREILKLRAELRRTEEERDILKRPQGTLLEIPSEVPVHQRTSSRASRENDVLGAAGFKQWILRLAWPAIV